MSFRDIDAELIQRAEQANANIILYPRLIELRKEIQLCQTVSRTSTEPQCMALEGRTGAGKTTLIKKYMEEFPRLSTPNGDVVRVFYLETPSPVNVKGMAYCMLDQLGDPFAHRGQTYSMTARLIKLIKACHVELVVVDDFHNLFDMKTERVLKEVAHWLKTLIKSTAVPFLVIGIEGKVDLILDADPNAELSRLFVSRETLHPFIWDNRDVATIEVFATFITYAESAVGMKLTPNIDRAQLLYLLHSGTRGVVAYIMKLLRYAQMNALERGSEYIELKDLQVAFDRRLLKHLEAKHLEAKVNPFVIQSLPNETTPPTITDTSKTPSQDGKPKKRGGKKQQSQSPKDDKPI